MALNKGAVQSSGSTAGRAVDGNRDPEFNGNSCSFTNTETSPWWRVDLQNVYKIKAVMITNTAAGGGLEGAEIWIGNSIKANATKNMRWNGEKTYITHLRGRKLSSLLSFPVHSHAGVLSSLTFQGDRHYTFHVALWRDATSSCSSQGSTEHWVSVKWKCTLWTMVHLFLSLSPHKCTREGLFKKCLVLL